MRDLLPCRACGRHLFSDEAVCPFCGVARVPSRRTAGGPAVMMGGALLAVAAACNGAVTVEHGAGGSAGSGGGATNRATSATSSTAPTSAYATTTNRSPTTQVFPDASSTRSGAPDAQALSDVDATVPDAAPECFGCDCPPFQCIYRSPPRRADWS